MDSKPRISAATRRNGSKQSLTAGKAWGTKRSWRTNEAAPISHRPGVLRMPRPPPTPGIRITNPPCHFSRWPVLDRRTGFPSETMRWFLFPPQMTQPVCAPTGIWTTTQPLIHRVTTRNFSRDREWHRLRSNANLRMIAANHWRNRVLQALVATDEFAAAFDGGGDGRQLWKRWSAHPTVS